MSDSATKSREALSALCDVLDRRPRLYAELADASDFGAYLAAGARQDDEEVLTELVLAEFLEKVLGFPADAYFSQLSKSGLKPDFTPMDLIAEGRVLVEAAERLVCALYAVPASLEEEVVKHAIARAEASGAGAV